MITGHAFLNMSLLRSDFRPLFIKLIISFIYHFSFIIQATGRLNLVIITSLR